MDSSDIKELTVLVIIALALAFSFNFGWNFLLNTDTPQVAVTTRSMTPTYWGFYDRPNDPEQVIGPFIIPVHWLRGDLLIVQGVPYEILNVGDVIVFDDPGLTIPVVHRIIAINETSTGRYFLTKGDDNPISDSDEVSWGNRFGWIHQSNVHGKIILRIPHVGWLSLQTQSVGGRMVLVLIAGLLLVLSFIGEDEKEKEEGNQSESSKEKEIIENKQELSISEVGNEKDETSGFEDKKSKITFSNQQSPSNDKKKRLFTSRSLYDVNPQQIYMFLKATLTKKMIPAWLLLIIVFIFSISASLNYLSGQCNVQVFMRDEDSFITEWSTINYIPGNNLFEKWNDRSSYPNYSIYSYNIKLAITSRGFFNWISAVELETNTSSNGQNDNLYRWSVVYDFHGTKVVNGCIKMYLPDNHGPTGVQVTVKAITSGMFNQGTIEWPPYDIQVSTMIN
ncbi:MAG: signal peptidase I [Candidatus Hodarchaeales archaeon]|jgi:signal peptidase I